MPMVALPFIILTALLLLAWSARFFPDKRQPDAGPQMGD